MGEEGREGKTGEKRERGREMVRKGDRRWEDLNPLMTQPYKIASV